MSRNTLLIHKAFALALIEEGITQLSWSKKVGIPKSTVNKFVNGGAPSQKLFPLIFAPDSWREKETGLQILRAHLQDEANRSGREPWEITIAIPDDSPQKELSRSLSIIKTRLGRDPSLQDLITLIADDIKQNDIFINPPDINTSAST
jgi:hypothetical protein